MKLYLTLALVALLFNFGIAKNVPRNLRTAATDEVLSQELSSESDLEDNVVDNENVVSNTVNLLETPQTLVAPVQTVPEVTLVENAPTKTVSTVSNTRLVSAQPAALVSKTLVAPLQTVQTVPVQTLNVVKSQSNLVRTQVPTSKTVVLSQPQQQVVYSQPQQQYTKYYVQQQPQTQYTWSAPQQQTWSAPQQQTQYTWSAPQQQTWSAPQQQQTWSAPQQQTQYTWSAPQQQQAQYTWSAPQQQVTYSQVPQQQLVSVAQQQPQQLVSVAQQQPQLTASVAQQQQQFVSAPANSEKLVVLNRNRNVQTNVARNNVLLLQPQQPAQLSAAVKTLTTKVSNPVVYQLTQSRPASLNRQTVLTGAQLVADVTDNESRDSVVVQEAESY